MQPHLKISTIRPLVLVCGDPARAHTIAQSCDTYEELAYNREYRSFNVTKNKKNFSVCSHGVGGAGAAVCFEELIKLGAKILIRVGTCGALDEKLKQGDIVICTSAVRDDGASKLMIPPEFPAVSDPDILQTLWEISLNIYKNISNISIIRGITYTCDLFYQSILPSKLSLYKDANVSCVEMEVSTLFIICKIRNIKAGAICVIDGSPLNWKDGDYNPTGPQTTEGKKIMIDIAIQAAVQLSND
eukprot:GHVL01029384.1.p1 GENE.GHVL01029384.1~~GHVL01029384.1.p1  ORF type:complete len:244 (-),score=57.85 GHVL01029384.1:119-850(-)